VGTTAITSRRAATLLSVLPLLLAAPGCNKSSGDGCLDLRTYYSEQVWGPVMSRTCINCHGPGGEAQIQGAKLHLLPSSYPGFLDANIENIRNVARFEVGGTSELLLKPMGELNHGGGPVIQQGGPEYQALSGLVERLRASTSSCPDSAAVATFPEALLLDAPATLRKAALTLVGRLPTAAETATAQAKGLAALDDLLGAMMKEESFFDRVKEIFNDFLLTDRYITWNGRSVGLLSADDFPGAGDAWFNTQDDGTKWYATLAVGREPLELIAYIVRNEHPFSEILTADYTVVNPWSAKVFGVDAPFASSTDPREFQPAHLSVMRDGALLKLPHAGVLTSPMFLNRFPTTPTNRNRHRARSVLSLFLATDILRFGDRPIDPTAATAYVNPTRDDPACNTCHAIIDPIAGAFQKWDEYDYDRYRPDQEWYAEMAEPGYGNERMPTSEFGAAEQWLAKRVVADPRFLQSVVATVFQAIVGHAPVDYPSDSTASDYAAKLRSWETQDATFRAIQQAFVQGNQNLKIVFREIIKTPYFRAVNITPTSDASRVAVLDNLGTGRLLTPELLARKIQATTGLAWTHGWDDGQYLLDDYRILYGGIDSDEINVRLDTPNGVMMGVATRMANEVACNVTAWDFTKDPSQRLLFPLVTLEHVPEAETGDPIPASIDAIKKNIQSLHQQLLGEPLDIGDPEIAATYSLFHDTWREGVAAVAANSEPEWLPCGASKDPLTGADLPDAQQINTDKRYTVRAWMAVITYLLSDYRFLYE
jgi:hypothetical protein